MSTCMHTQPRIHTCIVKVYGKVNSYMYIILQPKNRMKYAIVGNTNVYLFSYIHVRVVNGFMYCLHNKPFKTGVLTDRYKLANFP